MQGLFAGFATLAGLVLLFILGKKTGAEKQKEKTADEVKVYTEKKDAEVRNANVDKDTAQRTAALGAEIVRTIAQAAADRADNSLAHLADDAKTDEDALDIAKKQAERAQKFMLR